MIKKIILLIAAGVFITLMASNAMAFGIGAYATVGGGDSTHKVSTSYLEPYHNLFSSIPKSSNDLAVGAGLILDTNLATNGIFNYRLKIGGAKYWVDREEKMDMARMHLSNIFGFGIVRTKIIRWWLGPQVGASYSWGKRDNRTYYGFAREGFSYYFITGSSSIIYQGFINDKIKKISYGGVNAGVATGININIGKNLTIGVETGFKYNLNWGNQDRRLYSWPFPFEINKHSEKLFVHGWELYGEVAFMYRVSSDNYGRR